MARHTPAGMAVAAAAMCLIGAQAAAAQEEGKEAAMAETVQEGRSVGFEYTLKVDGQVVDTSEGRSPLRYVHGQGQLIPGVEQQLSGMQVGDEKQFNVAPAQGYGEVDQAAFVKVPKEQLPQDLALSVGTTLRGTSPEGQPFQARVHEMSGDTVTLDLNHPLAGKTLEFDVTVTDIEAAKAQP